MTKERHNDLNERILDQLPIEGPTINNHLTKDPLLTTHLWNDHLPPNFHNPLLLHKTRQHSCPNQNYPEMKAPPSGRSPSANWLHSMETEGRSSHSFRNVVCIYRSTRGSTPWMKTKLHLSCHTWQRKKLWNGNRHTFAVSSMMKEKSYSLHSNSSYRSSTTTSNQRTEQETQHTNWKYSNKERKQLKM